MTADLINLRRERKRLARAGNEAKGAANRAAFGIAPSLRAAAAAERERVEQQLQGHRRGIERGTPEEA